ncbi:hypothetical protein F5Y13DRAFT_188143 [Hypoxylon sp. FL1857]|nr:hypothetical protein F5Y13DRAFT_188143 [Hypoxylon sp. FL1857]
MVDQVYEIVGLEADKNKYKGVTSAGILGSSDQSPLHSTTSRRNFPTLNVIFIPPNTKLELLFVHKMQLIKSSLLALSLSTTSIAAPGISPATGDDLGARAPIPNFKVAWGQELQNSDQTNHWVVWVEGESACPTASKLSVLTNSPCGQPFNIRGQQLSFAGCSKNEPVNVLASDGSKVLSCSPNGKYGRQMNCHGDQHDIVQHGYCQ